jgi:tRNA (cytidine56-2'-O)-methyltransferase
MIGVLRIGHRPYRDKRITTHVALVARAFGAQAIWIDCADDRIEANVNRVTKKFGGDFKIKSGVEWKEFISKWKIDGGTVVHLTMYGMPLDKMSSKLKKEKDLLLVVGAEKVPHELYRLADYNLSVSNQPHSEIAALAICLDRLTGGKWIDKEFGGKIKIIPSEREKIVKGMGRSG